jgi:ribonuclease BN (tRNA processing enzyme)
MTNLSIHVLGCGDAFGSGGRLQTCYLIDSAESATLLDCGATALVAMRRFDVEPAKVDRILISHLHGDHFGGLPFLLLEAQFVSRRVRPLVIAGPPGIRQRLRDAQEVLFPGSSQLDLRFPLEIVELEAEQDARFGDLAAKPFNVVHPSGAPSFALRLSWRGRVVAFSGDTEWTDTLIEVARGADLFISECYGYEAKAPYHLNFKVLSARREELRVKRLLLTHLSGDMLSRAAALDSDVEVAEDGMVIEL